MLYACNQKNRIIDKIYETPQWLESSIFVPTDSINSTVIHIEEPHKVLKSSSIIDECSYIPLETNKEALIAIFTQIQIHRDKIYIMDRLRGEGLFIYSLDGKFIRKLGQKGGGSQEYGKISGFAIKKDGDYMVVYDSWKSRMMFYDLDGNFIRSKDLLFNESSSFALLPSNTILSISDSHEHNVHLGDFNRYRLIFSDTTMSNYKFGFEFDNNANLSIGWSNLYYYNGEYIYYPQFTNSIYSVSDTLIREKYRIDCSNIFSQFDINKITQFKSSEEFYEYWNATANLYPFIAENSHHLFFTVANQTIKYTYFYDKTNHKSVGFETMDFDGDFLVNFQDDIYNYGDYFLGIAPVNKLFELKDERQKSGNPLSKKISKMIDSLKDDDNDILVLFKLKEL